MPGAGEVSSFEIMAWGRAALKSKLSLKLCRIETVGCCNRLLDVLSLSCTKQISAWERIWPIDFRYLLYGFSHSRCKLVVAIQNERMLEVKRHGFANALSNSCDRTIETTTVLLLFGQMTKPE